MISLKQIFNYLTFTLVVLTFVNNSVNAQIQFKAGQDIVYTDTVKCDLFIAGNSVNTESVVNGDAFAAGQNINIREKVMGDLMLAGAEITVDGEVIEDIRVFGGQIKINKPVSGDILIFGGDVELNKEATVQGDVYLFSGKARIYSTINGNLTIKGGEAKIDGTVEGNLSMQCEDANFNGVLNGTSNINAERIYIGERTRFNNDVKYWTEKGEIDFKNSLHNSRATYSENLHAIENAKNESKSKFGFIWFALFKILGMALIILALTYFNPLFSKAAIQLKNDFMSSIGWGTIVVISLPLISLFLLITIIGIPLGIIGLTLTGLLIFISRALAALLLAHYINNQYQKNWSNKRIYFIAVAWYIAFWILKFIPLLGILISFLLVLAAIGSIIKELKMTRA